MDGGDRAGYKQISGAVDAVLIGPSTGSTDWTSGDWFRVRVISSKAAFAGIIASGISGSTRFTSGTSFNMGAVIEGSKITRIKLSSDSTGHAVQAFNRILL